MFDWAEYLKLAREIHGDKTEPACAEARFRCSISRAYYSNFNRACALAKREGLNLRYSDTLREPEENRGGLHSKVINFFLQSRDRTKRLLGLELDRMREKRVRADYRNEFVVVREEVIASFNLADTIMAKIDSIEARGSST